MKSEILEWDAYTLLDSGHGEKLEKFGPYVLIRPEPQALWPPSLKKDEWLKKADARFVRDNSKKSHRETRNENGGWTYFRKIPANWEMEYKPLGIRLKISCTSFGHTGVFVEQIGNWHFIHEQVKCLGGRPRVLNLFAYTGAASIAAAKAGADVTHLDAVRNVVSWANENKKLSQAPEIRWMVEDALRFVRKQASKGHKWQGIIIDPPAYGRGPDGEKWILEEQIDELVSLCASIASADYFVLLNLYSMGLSGRIGANLLKSHFGREPEWGEAVVPCATGYHLPLCTWVRLHS